MDLYKVAKKIIKCGGKWNLKYEIMASTFKIPSAFKQLDSTHK